MIILHKVVNEYTLFWADIVHLVSKIFSFIVLIKNGLEILLICDVSSLRRINTILQFLL